MGTGWSVCVAIVVLLAVAASTSISIEDATPGQVTNDVSPDSIMFGYAFGDQTVETQGPDTHGCGSAEASSFYTLRSGAVNALVIWHAANAGENVTSVIVGLYDNLGDSPNNLLGQGTITPGGALAGDTWYTATIPDVAFSANAIYWIAMTCPVGAEPACPCSTGTSARRARGPANRVQPCHVPNTVLRTT